MRRLRSRTNNSELGAAFLEVIFVIPIFALILASVFDLTQILNRKSAMSSLTREATLRSYRECILSSSLDTIPADLSESADVKACLDQIVAEFRTSYIPNGGPEDSDIMISVYVADTLGNIHVVSSGPSDPTHLSRFDESRMGADTDMADLLANGPVTIAEVFAPFYGTILPDRILQEISVM